MFTIKAKKHQSTRQAVHQSAVPQRKVSQRAAVLEDNRPDIAQKNDNRTGLPNNLKSGMENISGMSLDHVKVHYNSGKPAAVQAHAYAQGSNIYLGPGQEKHLPHELGHVVQQAQGRVKPTVQMKGISINDEIGLEREADRMGGKALQLSSIIINPQHNETSKAIIQKQTISEQSPKFHSGSITSSSQIAQLQEIRYLGHIIWDTTLDAAEKIIKIKGIDEKKRKLILTKITDAQEKKDFETLCNQNPFLSTPPVSDTEVVPEKNSKPGLPAKKDPSTTVNKLQINYITRPGGEKSEKQHGFLEFFAQQAADIGFELEVLTTEQGKALCEPVLQSHASLRYTIKTSYLAPSEWAEDSVEFLDGENRATLRKFKDNHLADGIDKGRKERWGEADFNRNKQARETGVPEGLKVNAGNTGKIIEQTSTTVGNIRSYIEGGNMIVTENKEGTSVILVGKDSIAATMEAYKISSDRVLSIMAEDFGVTPKQIIPVEQPGKFHLDMGLMSLGKGVIIVNNSNERTNVLKSKLETLAEKDLLEAGFTVRRDKLEDGENFNFFNGEYVTGSDGKKYYLTNGGSKDQEREFRDFMIKNANVEDVRFAPRGISRDSLSEQGGVGCRAKGSTVRKDASAKRTHSEGTEESKKEDVILALEMDSEALAGRYIPGTELRFEYLNNTVDVIGRVLTTAKAKSTNVADQLALLQDRGDETTAIGLQTVFKTVEVGSDSRETVRAPHIVVLAVRMLDHATGEEIVRGQENAHTIEHIPNVIGFIFTLTERDIIK